MNKLTLSNTFCKDDFKPYKSVLLDDEPIYDICIEEYQDKCYVSVEEFQILNRIILNKLQTKNANS